MGQRVVVELRLVWQVGREGVRVCVWVLWNMMLLLHGVRYCMRGWDRRCVVVVREDRMLVPVTRDVRICMHGRERRW